MTGRRVLMNHECIPHQRQATIGPTFRLRIARACHARAVTQRSRDDAKTCPKRVSAESVLAQVHKY